MNAHRIDFVSALLVQGLARASSSTISCASCHALERQLSGTDVIQEKWSGLVPQESPKVHTRPSMQTLLIRRPGERPSQPENSRQDAAGHSESGRAAGGCCKHVPAVAVARRYLVDGKRPVHTAAKTVLVTSLDYDAWKVGSPASVV